MSSQEYWSKIRTSRITRRKFLGGAAAVAGGLLASYRPSFAATGEGIGPPVRPFSLPAVRATRNAPQGTLTWLSSEALAGSWDPVKHTVTANQHAEWNAFDRLFEVDTVTGEFVPMLGLTYEVIPEGLKFTLRRDVKFHEGQPFTAADVKYSFERYSDPDNPTGSFFSGKVEGKVIDDYTCQILTETPLPVLNLSALIQIHSHLDDEEKLAKGHNGTGPFKLAKYERETVYYKANMDYWMGPPRLEEYRQTYVSDASTRLAALQKGEADVIERVPGDHISIVEKDPNLGLVNMPSNELTWLCFKMGNHEITKNKALRQAIAHCIDRKGIVQGIMSGYADVAQGHLSHQTWPFGAPAGDALPQYDLEAAKQKLAEAGYPGGKGLPELHCIGVTGLYANMKEYIEYVAAECRKVGIPIKVEVKEMAAWIEDLFAKESCDLIFTGWIDMSPEPDEVLRALHRCPGLITFLCDPKVDEVLDRQTHARDLETRAKIIREELIPLLADECVTIPIANNRIIQARSQKVKNYAVLHNSCFLLWDVYKEA